MHSSKSINLLIGHRGVGKSTLLKRIKNYFGEQIKNVHTYDLDEIIEKNEGPVSEIFLKYGEDHFRDLEKKYFDKIMELSRPRKQLTFIAVGAGFRNSLPEDVNVIWVRRESDSFGRVFLDRPRLDLGISTMEEYHKRKSDRDVWFNEIYDQQIVLREGKYNSDDGERFFFGLVERTIPYSYTLRGLNERRIEQVILRFDNWISFFEVRDDLLTEELAARATELISQKKILYSFRTKNSYLNKYNLKYSIVDWALELGPCPFSNVDILSLHENIDGDLEKSLDHLSTQNSRFVKLSVEIENLSELKKAHDWWMEDLRKRIFLPRSKDGRWAWYRSQFCFRNFLSFFKDDIGGPCEDQPGLLDIMSYPTGDTVRALGPENFAAVLGEPVVESWTPTFQQSFFNEFHMPVYRLSMGEDEVTEENMEILKNFGMRAAAVTAPLKNKMYEVVADENEFRATNTIAYDNGWHGTNTDIFGIEELLKNIKDEDNIVVWGGGGILETVKEVVPQARFVSARKGVDSTEPTPNILVWAVGRNRMEDIQLPPENWTPSQVIDLNYSQSSPGIQLADGYRCNYVNGESMFFEQGEKQREFWRKFFKS